MQIYYGDTLSWIKTYQWRNLIWAGWNISPFSDFLDHLFRKNHQIYQKGKIDINAEVYRQSPLQALMFIGQDISVGPAQASRVALITVEWFSTSHDLLGCSLARAASPLPPSLPLSVPAAELHPSTGTPACPLSLWPTFSSKSKHSSTPPPPALLKSPSSSKWMPLSRSWLYFVVL